MDGLTMGAPSVRRPPFHNRCMRTAACTSLPVSPPDRPPGEGTSPSPGARSPTPGQRRLSRACPARTRTRAPAGGGGGRGGGGGGGGHSLYVSVRLPAFSPRREPVPSAPPSHPVPRPSLHLTLHPAPSSHSPTPSHTLPQPHPPHTHQRERLEAVALPSPWAPAASTAPGAPSQAPSQQLHQLGVGLGRGRRAATRGTWRPARDEPGDLCRGARGVGSEAFGPSTVPGACSIIGGERGGGGAPPAPGASEGHLHPAV
jgi:hypothetical protein